jgi:hypothetical protein
MAIGGPAIGHHHIRYCPQTPIKSSQITMSRSATGEEQDYEEQHVHRVYEQIAGHFSSTRYKVSFNMSQ